MSIEARRPRLRLPEKLVSTAFRVTIAGALSCAGSSAQSSDMTSDAGLEGGADVFSEAASDAKTQPTPEAAPADAASDAASDAPDDVVALDASGDVSSDTSVTCANGSPPADFCGPAVADASCPGLVCDLSLCPFDAGCEPFV
jgi:hypothetical protein